jgi:hypothetical protein
MQNLIATFSPKSNPAVFETSTTKPNQLYCPKSFPKDIRLFDSKYFKQTPSKEAKHNIVPLQYHNISFFQNIKPIES